MYIIRANDLTEVDGALGLLNLDCQTKQSDAGKVIDASTWLLLVSLCIFKRFKT